METYSRKNLPHLSTSIKEQHTFPLDSYHHQGQQQQRPTHSPVYPLQHQHVLQENHPYSAYDDSPVEEPQYRLLQDLDSRKDRGGSSSVTTAYQHQHQPAYFYTNSPIASLVRRQLDPASDPYQQSVHPQLSATYPQLHYNTAPTNTAAAANTMSRTMTTLQQGTQTTAPLAPSKQAAGLSRKRPPAPSTVSSRTTGSTSLYRVESQVLPTGEKRDLVVLEDTPTPPPQGKKRSRPVNGEISGVRPTTADKVPAAKKRKAVDGAIASGPSTKKLYNYQQPIASGSSSSTQRTSQAVASSQPSCDDPEGHYIIKEGDVIAGKYRIIKKLGEGTFGKVVEAVDNQTRRHFAVKIIRAVQKYRDASKIEVRVLERLKASDPTNVYKCIHLTDHFDHKNHVCLVFELLGLSVFDFLKANSFIPFPLRHIQDFARQLLHSVSYLHKLRLVHTDLKPENILLADGQYQVVNSKRSNPTERRILSNTDIRLIDFGSATFEEEYHSTVVSTRHYRAPEIILGLGWSYPCDMFSIGCILVEFFTGEALFQTHGNLEHLVMMEIVMGRMPDHMMRTGARSKPEMFRNGKLDYPNAQTDKASKKFLKGMKSLDQIIPPTTVVQSRFSDLIKKLLAFDPERRIDVRTALNHPFFHLNINLE